MTLSFRIAGLVVIVCSLAANATAHPGHGESGVAHYITDPRHLLTVVLAIFGVTTICWLMLFHRRQEQA